MHSGSRTYIDLSHTITPGMETYPGLPVPSVEAHLTREAAEEVYGPGITFEIGMVHLCTNTGTYLDVPYHRYADGHDLTELSLERVADVPGVCLDRRETAAIDLTAAELEGLTGHAVLIRTDHSRTFGNERYGVDHPYLTESAAEALVTANVAVVGIDSLNIDSTDDGRRPVHSILLRAGIPIVEHLTELDRLPQSESESRFRFWAVPPKIAGAGTFTVRAHATVTAV